MRLCLSCCESVNESNSNYDIVKELLATMSYTDKPSPVLKFIPVTDKWNVWYFRHKMKTTYSYQGKYFITASRIDSKRVKSAKNQVTIFTPSDYDECHEEVEVRTVLPRCYAPPPPLFATYFQELKKREGITARKCARLIVILPSQLVHLLALSM